MNFIMIGVLLREALDRLRVHFEHVSCDDDDDDYDYDSDSVC